ncbi:MAG TPA: hypothetical protein VGP80_12580 [Gemmatimonadales bacterium]|nr:hypothetical protein [Gemmatimonadales bacterium]
MAERRYTDEEVAAIFERATETEHAALPAAEGKGMTLAALQEIGREAGISPESISAAARSLDTAGRLTSRTFMGFPVGVGRTVELGRPLSDQEWERLVADLRVTFEARGRVRYDGPYRQWTNGNLQALVEPTPAGHRVRLQTVKGDARGLMAGGMVIAAGATAALISVAVNGGLRNSGSLLDIAFIAALGLGLFAASAFRLPGWARRRRGQIEQITARLAMAAESAPQDDPKVGGGP